MPKNLPFVHKLLKSLDKIDRAALEKYILDQAETRLTLETILHEIHEGAMIMNREGEITFANPPALSWLGLPKTGNARPHVMQIGDSEISRFLDSRRKSLRERATADFKVLIPRETYLRVFMIPFEKDGNILILLLNLTTERSAETGEARRDSVGSLLSLAAGIAHEIGNPLNSIGIHLGLLQKEIKSLPDNKKQSFEKTLEVLKSETGRLDRIVRNFLKAVRRPPLRFRCEDLNSVLKSAIDFMLPELEENKVKVRFKADKSIPEFLMDRERLHQTFINLIKNAMEAMPEGGSLTIRTSRKEKAAMLIFSDEGQGISEEDLPHIFEAYYTTKSEGSGLGLMTVWKTVKEHGGRIEVSSKVRQGTTFTLLLPIREPKLQLSHSRK